MSGAVISMRTNFPDVAAALDRVGVDAGNKAMVRALNATVEQGKPAMARQISQEFRVKVSDVKKRLYIERAVVKNGVMRFQAMLLASRPGGLHGNDDWRGMNLINFVFGGQPKRNKKGVMGQLKFQIKRSGGRKEVPGAFVATSRKTGGRAVFVRDGKARMPIRTLTTIDVAQMFNTRRINSVVRNIMLQRFSPNFHRELRAVLGGFAK